MGTKRPPRVDRREQALTFVAECGITGGTWKELSAATGLHHGSASSALSILHKAGRIAQLAEGKRDRCLPYVLPDLVAGRPVRPPGRGPSRPVQELVDAGWQEGYDRAMAEVRERPDLDQVREHAYLMGVSRGRHDEALRLMRLVAEMRRTLRGQHLVLAHSGGCWQQHPDCALLAIEKALLKTLPPPVRKDPAA